MAAPDVVDANERPIQFSGAMVRAILAGIKTQARLPIELQLNGRVKDSGSPRNWHVDDPECVKACPYGVPGTRLWVQEAWQYPTYADWFPPNQPRGPKGYISYRATQKGECDRWRSAADMPRWASRILLEVVDVDIRRVRQIKERDAKAEGVKKLCDHCGNTPVHESHWVCEVDYRPTITHREGFRRLWAQLYGPESWRRNDFVWVITFTVLMPDAGSLA